MKRTSVVVLCVLNITLSFADGSDALVYRHNNTIKAVLRPGELSTKYCSSYTTARQSMVDGRTSVNSTYPYMAIIDYGYKKRGRGLCTGALISKKMVVTAAHCIKKGPKGPKYVRLGYRAGRDNLQNFTVVKSISHPHYEPPVKYADIALLELDREVRFTEFVFPACINTNEELNNASLFLISQNKSVLHYIIDNRCFYLFGIEIESELPYGFVDDVQICAKGMEKTKLKGVSGTPLLMELKDSNVTTYKVIGITCFDAPSNSTGAPTVFTRVDSYLSWLEIYAWQDESVENTQFYSFL